MYNTAVPGTEGSYRAADTHGKDKTPLQESAFPDVSVFLPQPARTLTTECVTIPAVMPGKQRRDPHGRRGERAKAIRKLQMVTGRK